MVFHIRRSWWLLIAVIGVGGLQFAFRGPNEELSRFGRPLVESEALHLAPDQRLLRVQLELERRLMKDGRKLDRLTPEAATIVALARYEEELSRGGFDGQRLAPDELKALADAYEATGQTRCATTLRELIAAGGGGERFQHWAKVWKSTESHAAQLRYVDANLTRILAQP
jgi:hypothetical protein